MRLLKVRSLETATVTEPSGQTVVTQTQTLEPVDEVGDAVPMTQLAFQLGRIYQSGQSLPFAKLLSELDVDKDDREAFKDGVDQLRKDISPEEKEKVAQNLIGLTTIFGLKKLRS